MKALNIILVLTFATMLSFVSLSNAPATEDTDIIRVEAFVRALSDEVTDILKAPATPIAREVAFQSVLDRYFDVRRTARFALGQYARTISKADLATYTTLANVFIIKIYTNRLGLFSGEQVLLRGTRAHGSNFVTTAQIVFNTGRPPIDIAFWVVRHKSGKIRLFDLQVAGIWMAQEQRESFVSILSNNNGDINVLIDTIRARING